MVSKVDAYLKKAEKNIALAKTSYNLSTHACLRESMGIGKDMTFLEDVITRSYYSIFYATQAYTVLNGLKGSAKTTHTRTYEALEKGLRSKKMRNQQIKIQESEILSIQELLDIFLLEKYKRGLSTYDLKYNASLDEAKDSIEHAETFFAAISHLLETRIPD